MNRGVIYNSTKCRTKFTLASDPPYSKQRNCVPKFGKSWPATPYRYFHAWKYYTHWYGRNKVCLRTRKRSGLDDRTPLRWFYQCVSWTIKKGGTIRDLFNPEEPPSTLHVNKHEQSTPNKDVNLHLLILVYFKLAVFRTENKSKSSNIFTNKYEWKRYSKCLYLYIFISIQDKSPTFKANL